MSTDHTKKLESITDELYNFSIIEYDPEKEQILRQKLQQILSDSPELAVEIKTRFFNLFMHNKANYFVDNILPFNEEPGS